MNNLSLKLNKSDKRYVTETDQCVGYIPEFDVSLSKSGFIVTASSEHSRLTAAPFAFCSWKPVWKVERKDNM